MAILSSRRKSLALLALALPLALVVSGWSTAREWWGLKELRALPVKSGEAVAYAGAEWRLGALSKVATRSDGSAIVLAEFSARVTDPTAFAVLPCQAYLTAAGGPRWLPAFMSAPEVRKTRPAAVDKPTCGTAKVGKFEQGSTVEMAETFQLPWMEFERVQLAISLPPGRPSYLLFER